MRHIRFLAVALAAAVTFAAPAFAQTTLKMNISLAQNSHYGVAIDTFAREVEKRTNGRYKVQNFYSGALGAERESIEALQLGTLDLTIAGRGNVPGSGAVAAVLNLTATNPTKVGYITAWPTSQTRPLQARRPRGTRYWRDRYRHC